MLLRCTPLPQSDKGLCTAGGSFKVDLWLRNANPAVFCRAQLTRPPLQMTQPAGRHASDQLTRRHATPSCAGLLCRTRPCCLAAGRQAHTVVSESCSEAVARAQQRVLTTAASCHSIHMQHAAGCPLLPAAAQHSFMHLMQPMPFKQLTESASSASCSRAKAPCWGRAMGAKVVLAEVMEAAEERVASSLDRISDMMLCGTTITQSQALLAPQAM